MQACRVSPEPHCVGNRLGYCDPLFEDTASVADTLRGLSVARAAGLAKLEREGLAEAETLLLVVSYP